MYEAEICLNRAKVALKYFRIRNREGDRERLNRAKVALK